MSARRRWGLLAIIVLVPATATGFLIYRATSPDDSAAKPALPYSLCPVSRSDDKLVNPSKIGEEAHPYVGPGPHPVLIVEMDEDPGSGVVTDRYTEDGLPDAWQPPRDGKPLSDYEYDKVQLVVCQYRHSVGTNNNLDSCVYHTGLGSLPVFTRRTVSAEYTYRVYEAKTEKPLDEFDLTGTLNATCLYWRTILPGNEGTTEKVAAAPDPAKVADRLRPLVEGNPGK